MLLFTRSVRCTYHWAERVDIVNQGWDKGLCKTVLFEWKNARHVIIFARANLTGDTLKMVVLRPSKSLTTNSARVLVGCKLLESQIKLFLQLIEISFVYIYRFIVARCTTGPRRAANNASRFTRSRRNAPLGLAELWRIDIVNQIDLQLTKTRAELYY